MRRLKLLSLVFFIGIFSCQIYIPTITTKSNLEKWDIDYTQLKYEINDMAIDSECNLYVTTFKKLLAGLGIAYEKGTILDEKIFKITPEGKISEFIIYDENNKPVNIFPRLKGQTKDSVSFTPYYNYMNFIIKNDYLYTSYQYFYTSGEKGFLKLDIKNNVLRKYPQENIEEKFFVDNNDEIVYKYFENNYIKITDVNKTEIIPNFYEKQPIYTNNKNETFKLDNKGKAEKLFINSINDDILGLKLKVKIFNTDKKGNIFFIASKFKESDRYYGSPFSTPILENNYLYKIDSNNKLYLLYYFYNKNENYLKIDVDYMCLDEEKQVLYFSSKNEKSIYKIKL